MIKHNIFENDLIDGMQHQLIKQATQVENNNLEQAVNLLNSAAEIFEDLGLITNANDVLHILNKIAKKHKPKNPTKIPNHHTKDLTPEKMIENLKRHGIVFNLADDGKDLLD